MTQRNWPARIAVAVVLLCLVVALFAMDHWTGNLVSKFFGAFAIGVVPVALLLAFVGLFVIADRITARSGDHEEATPEREPARWIDEPVDLDDVDDYDRRPFVDRLLEVVKVASVERSSTVIGLSGPWGSGKSSVLKTLTRRLREDGEEKAVLVAQVNPWRYGSTDALVLGVFSEIRAAMPPEARWSEARERLIELLESSEPFGAFTSPLGFDGSRVLGLTARRLGRAQATRAQERAEAALRAMRRPILVVVDDLDRLGPDELLSLFRAIRLLGRLPYVHYLLTLDSDVVADVLTRTGLVGKKVSSAHRYLEKMIQLRLDLPPVRRVDIDRVVDKSIERALEAADALLPPDREAEFAFIYNTEIAATLSSPRSVQRWIAHIAITYPALARDVDFVDFVLFTWLRIFYPGVVELMRTRKYALLRGEDLASALIKYDVAERDSAWRRWISTAGVPGDDVDRVYTVLARMFPEVAKARSKSNSDNWSAFEAALRRRGIGHADYFERYFALAVPREEISEKDFLEQIRSATSQDLPDTTSALALSIRTSNNSLLGRIENWANENPELRLPLIRWLAANYVDADHFDILSPQEAIRGLLHRLVVADGRFKEFILAILSVPDGLHTASLVLADLRRASVDGESLTEITDDVVRLIRLDLDRRIVSPIDFDVDSRSLLWLWQAIDNGSVREWFLGRITLGWSLVEAVAVLVGLSRPLGVKNAAYELTGVEQSSLDAFFNPDWLVAQLKVPEVVESLEGETATASSFERLPDSWGNRLAIARRVLRNYSARHPDHDD